MKWPLLRHLTASRQNHVRETFCLLGADANLPSEGNPKSLARVRGRPFEKGNGGRRPGSKNKTTLAAEALVKGEEVELVRKAIELAKDGDTQMLEFLLDRILPKERSVHVDLPDVDRAFDAVNAMGAVIAAVGSGQILSEWISRLQG
jgi:hypothetical protein